MKGFRSLGVVLAMTCLLLGADVVPGNEREAGVRAAFVYNIARFVEWPAASFAGDDATLNLCVPQARERVARLEFLHGRSAQGRAISVEPVQWPDVGGRCHLLYLAGEEPADSPLLQSLQYEPVLTIGEGRGFLDQGGMIGLYLVDDHVRFNVDLSRLQASGLRISARILQLAQEVR